MYSKIIGWVVFKKISGLCLLLMIVSGCRSQPAAETFRLYVGPTAVLPTALPTQAPTATSTLVMLNAWTPTPVPTATPLPDEVLAFIVDIVDGNTVLVVLEGDSLSLDYTVELIGVDVPPDTATSPWGGVALAQMKSWLRGKAVRLVRDNTLVTDEGILPRYLYLGDELINLRLITLGLGTPAFSDPDRLFEADFEAAAASAQANQRGLWGQNPTATPIPPLIEATVTATSTTATP